MRKRVGWLILYLLSYFLAYFVVIFARRPHFRFADSLIIGFAKAEVESRDIDIAIDFFG